jgi:hypothetical protein
LNNLIETNTLGRKGVGRKGKGIVNRKGDESLK